MTTSLNHKDLKTTHRYLTDGADVVKKGKNTFTKDQVAAIKHHLQNLVVVAHGESRKELIKTLKEECCFYFTDFTDSRKQFTVYDFDDLVSRGEILITV